jgi:dihydroorotate dehydrogenase (NAD+) catalytic subunit
MRLKTRLGPIELRTPIIAASGTFGYGSEYDGICDFAYYGAITLKAVSVEPRLGNPYPRIVETPSGMLNCIGLENPGLDVFLSEKLPDAARLGVPLIANLVGDMVEDYVRLAEALDQCDELIALEINASCPNVENGLAFASDASCMADLVSSVCGATSKPIIAKLSPNVTDIVPIARAAVDSGADILNLGNTVLGMSIDIDTRQSRMSRDYAGLSGRAIRPIAVRIVHQAASVVRIPIIGTGGVYDATDALEFIIAGASAVSIGTVNFIDPDSASRICKGIETYLDERGISLAELVGSYKGVPDVGAT